jgi:spore coat protein U-like protein
MTLLDIASVSITATVASQIQSVIVSTGSPFDENQPATYSMDFGVVSDTQSLSADLSIRSNDGYDVQARSLNQNKLVHTSESNATMNYKFYVNSQLMDLTNGSNVQVATGTGITALTGTNIPLQVTLDDTFNKLSGTYQDTIIFTVAPSP